MLKTIYWYGITAALLWTSLQVPAQQLDFSHTQNNGQHHYSYQWRDAQQQTQSLNFSIEADVLANAPGEPIRYSQARVQRYVYVALTKAAQQVDPKQAKVSIEQQERGVQIAVRSTSRDLNQKLTRELKATREAAFAEFLDKHYYTRYTTVFDEKAVKPDHARYVDAYTRVLVPLSQAIYEKVQQQSDARRYLNLLLGWVQTIPYDTLEDRTQHSGAGFNPPARLLNLNLGDCDSKSVLSAAIIRAFLPDTPLVMVLLPNHALLGIALKPDEGEQSIEYDGETYVLFEPTGPALLPFGEVASKSYQDIANGHYTLEAL